MTYEQTLDWMFGRLPMYQQKGKTAYTAKLDNILNFCAQLGAPHTRFKSIHVGGTNGKGSSSHMLASVLQEAGYRVGLYTSPHLKDFRERIKINGVVAAKDFVTTFIEENRSYLEKHKLSFFEMTVGMAFEYFAREKVDIAIIEVGLGGRLDSTNIIVPEVSLITNIEWDHTDLLGDSLEQITREKAGIIKTGVPVVISEYQEETAAIFEEVATERGSDIEFAEKTVTSAYQTDLLGKYQSKNIKGVVAVISRLKDFEVSSEQLRAGLLHVVDNTGLLGRWQIIGQSPKIICDTAHNREGISVVMEQLLQQEYKNLHMVLGFVEDKNLEMILPLFPDNAQYYVARPDIRRGLDAEVLFNALNSLDRDVSIYSSVSTALEAAKSEANPSDIIYVGGSTFTVAEVL